MGNNSNSNQRRSIYKGSEKILTLSDINKLSLSVCKIKINNIIQGTGFLIDSDKIGKGIMTCHHVINFQSL